MCVLRACIAEGVFELCWGSWWADIYSVLYISHSLSSQLWFHSLWARQLSKTSWSPYTQHAFLPSYNAWCWICTCFPGKVIWWFPNCWHTLRWWVVADELCVVRICSAIVSVPFTFGFLYFTHTEEIARFKGPPVMPEKERSGWGAQDVAGNHYPALQYWLHLVWVVVFASSVYGHHSHHRIPVVRGVHPHLGVAFHWVVASCAGTRWWGPSSGWMR